MNTKRTIVLALTILALAAAPAALAAPRDGDRPLVGTFQFRPKIDLYGYRAECSQREEQKCYDLCVDLGPEAFGAKPTALLFDSCERNYDNFVGEPAACSQSGPGCYAIECTCRWQDVVDHPWQHA